MSKHFTAALRRAWPHHLSALLLLLAVATLAAWAAAPSVALAQEGASGVVAADITRLNVRNGAGATFAIVAKLEPGSTLTVLAVDESGDWLQVSANGVEGWVFAAFVVQGAPSSATVSVPATSSTPVSALARAAGLRPSPVATATATVVSALPTATPRATRTVTPAATAATLVVSPTPKASATPVTTPTPTPSPAPEPTEEPVAESTAPLAVVVPNSMNVRSGPGTGYDRIGSVGANDRLEITASNSAADWFRVKLADGGEGWVFSGLVLTSGPMENVTKLAEDDLPPLPVAAQSAAGASVALAPLPSGGGGFGYGITASMWQSDKAGVAASVLDLGFGWVKQQVRWEFVETAPGAVNWQEMDDIVNTMNGYGVNVAFSIVTVPAWTRPTKGGTNGPPEDFQLFANFVGGVAGRYCGQSLRAIEVWNEQNLRREWEGFALDPALYMDLLRRSYASIKAACPSMVVISGATTPAGYSDVAFDDIDYLRGMYQNGLARYSDAVGIHPSGFANPPGVRFGDWQSGAYSALSHADHRSFYFLSTLEESRAVMEQNGDGGKKLWPTEFGWGSSPQPYPGYEYQARISEQQQADWITDAYRIMGNSGYVGVAFLWNLNYNYGEMQTFSVVGRPAYQALKSLTGR